MRSALRLAGAALLLLPLAAHPAQWSAAGITGAIVPSNAGPAPDHAPIAAWSGGGITFYEGLFTGGFGPQVIQISYNVTSDDPQPAWTTLIMGYSGVVSGTSVVATLYKVNRSTGNQAMICSATSNGTHTERSCTFSSTAVNFENYAYYVLVTLSRDAGHKLPRINTLRLHE